MKTTREKTTSKTTPAVEAPTPTEAKKRRRRRRRNSSAILAARTISDIKAKQRAFLREASRLLTEALGFPVRVSQVRAAEPMSPDMRRASRLTVKQARRQIADSFSAPLAPRRAAADLDDSLPF